MIVKARHLTKEAEHETSTDGESAASTRTADHQGKLPEQPIIVEARCSTKEAENKTCAYHESATGDGHVHGAHQPGHGQDRAAKAAAVASLRARFDAGCYRIWQVLVIIPNKF